MKFIYPAIIHDDADGFWAEFPDLEYTSSTGSTLTELITNAQEAMELYILGALEDGQTLPTPTSIRSLPCTDTTYPTLVQTDIDLAKNSKSVKKTLTIPAWLTAVQIEKVELKFCERIRNRRMRKEDAYMASMQSFAMRASFQLPVEIVLEGDRPVKSETFMI